MLTTLRTYADEVVDFTCENLADVVVSSGEESPNGISLSIFPNPAQDNLTIQLSENSQGQFTITDLTGRKVMQGRIWSSKTAIDITGLNQGLYILSIETPEISASRKILKTE